MEGLRGQVTEHHRFLLRLYLEQIQALERLVAELEAEVGRHLEPFRAQVEALSTVPGIQQTAASVLFAETGGDRSVFASPGPLLSWAGLCPRLDESAGKRRSTRLRKSGRRLKATLVQAAWAAIKQRDS